MIKDQLSPCEYRIAMLVYEGYSNKRIGIQLKVSEYVVKVNLNSIYSKLSIKGKPTLKFLISIELQGNLNDVVKF